MKPTPARLRKITIVAAYFLVSIYPIFGAAWEFHQTTRNCETLLSSLGSNQSGVYTSPAFEELYETYAQTGTGLLSQNDGSLKDPSKACALVCGANIIQAIKRVNGEPLLIDPFKLVNELQIKHPELHNGVRPARIADTVQKLLEDFFPFSKLQLTSKTLDIGVPASDRSFSKMVRSMLISDIGNGHGVVQILGYLVIRDGKIVGAHAVILLKKSSGTISVLDSNFLKELVDYKLEPIVIDGVGMNTVELVPDSYTANVVRDYFGSGSKILVNAVVNVQAPD